jgi:hypothetical protein
MTKNGGRAGCFAAGARKHVLWCSNTIVNRWAATATARKCNMLRLEKRCGETTVRSLASMKKQKLHLAGKKNPLRFQPLVRARPKTAPL